MDDLDLIATLCADLTVADWLLYSGWMLEHRSAELGSATLTELTARRVEVTLAGLLECGPGPTDRVH